MRADWVWSSVHLWLQTFTGFFFPYETDETLPVQLEQMFGASFSVILCALNGHWNDSVNIISMVFTPLYNGCIELLQWMKNADTEGAKMLRMYQFIEPQEIFKSSNQKFETSCHWGFVLINSWMGFLVLFCGVFFESLGIFLLDLTVFAFLVFFFAMLRTLNFSIQTQRVGCRNSCCYSEIHVSIVFLWGSYHCHCEIKCMEWVTYNS